MVSNLNQNINQEQDLPPVKPESNKIKEQVNKLSEATNSSSRILLHIKTVFPFTLFPDQLIIDPTKVTIIDSQFYYTDRIKSINIVDILEVAITFNIWLASLVITTRFFNGEAAHLNYLRKDDARIARRLIQGLVIANQRGLKIDEVPISELKQKIAVLGKSQVITP